MYSKNNGLRIKLYGSVIQTYASRTYHFLYWFELLLLKYQAHSKATFVAFSKNTNKLV